MCLGIPARIVRITDRKRGLAAVAVSGVEREADLSCVLADGQLPEVLIGDWILLHVGFAMALIDAEEAANTLAALDAIGEAEIELDAIRNTARPEPTPAKETAA